jgi:hypothetical protein
VNGDYAKYKKHFPPGDDVTLIILKGHLLIEDYMYQLLAEHFERPMCLKQANLSFSKLKWVTEGLCYKSFDRWLWNAIGVVNQIRNALAHELEPRGHVEQLNKLFQIMRNECPVNGFFAHAKTKAESEMLRRALADILFYLLAMRKHEESA